MRTHISAANRAAFSCLVATAVLAIGAVATAGTYYTGFEDPPFSTGSIDGQDGWMATNSSFEQEVVNTVAYTGAQSWQRGNNFVSGSFGDQPFSAPLPSGEMVGESTAVGVTSGLTVHSYSIWFRAGNTLEADGSYVNLSLSDTGGSRMNFAGLRNTDAGGLTLTAYDATSNGFGNAVDFNLFSLTPTPLDRTAWHQLEVVSTFSEGAANDVVQYYVDGSLEATIGSWEDYYRDDPEQAGNGNLLYASDRVLFRTAASPSVLGAFTDGDALGFYFDDFSSTATVPEPSTFALGGLGLGLLGYYGVRRRRRRRS